MDLDAEPRVAPEVPMKHGPQDLLICADFLSKSATYPGWGPAKAGLSLLFCEDVFVENLCVQNCVGKKD
jgi:hypothetical protein